MEFIRAMYFRMHWISNEKLSTMISGHDSLFTKRLRDIPESPYKYTRR